MRKSLAVIVLIYAFAFIQPTQAADYVNSIGMKFKKIQPGCFYMGSCREAKYLDAENEIRKSMGDSVITEKMRCPSGSNVDIDALSREFPQHKICITKGFQLGIYEVTVGQYKKFITDSGRNELLTDFITGSHSDNDAVSGVSWNEAQDFINWLNKKEGGSHYRLPTEAEWEYAARAGTTTIYSWGDNVDLASDYAWCIQTIDGKNHFYAHEVGCKKPNPWGLYDMHGNVWEWVQDLYSEIYYFDSPTNDPHGPALDQNRVPPIENWENFLKIMQSAPKKLLSEQYRVQRGGSWCDYLISLRSASRGANTPDSHYINLGFRLLREP